MPLEAQRRLICYACREKSEPFWPSDGFPEGWEEVVNEHGGGGHYGLTWNSYDIACPECIEKRKKWEEEE